MTACRDLTGRGRLRSILISEKRLSMNFHLPQICPRCSEKDPQTSADVLMVADIFHFFPHGSVVPPLLCDQLQYHKTVLVGLPPKAQIDSTEGSGLSSGKSAWVFEAAKDDNERLKHSSRPESEYRDEDKVDDMLARMELLSRSSRAHQTILQISSL